MGKTSAPEKINLSGQPASNVAAAWQGLANLFGASYDTFSVTPEGIEITGFSVANGVNPNEIVTDISHRARQVDFLAAYDVFVAGNTAAPFATKAEVQAWLTQYMRGSVEDGTARVKAYARDAAQGYKSANSLSAKRGRPRKTIRLDSLDEVTPDMLAKISPEDLSNLESLIAQAKTAQAAASVATVSAS